MVWACNPSYSGGWGKGMAWNQEVKVAVSWDGAAALQPGLQSKTLSKKEKEIPTSQNSSNYKVDRN